MKLIWDLVFQWRMQTPLTTDYSWQHRVICERQKDIQLQLLPVGFAFSLSFDSSFGRHDLYWVHVAWIPQANRVYLLTKKTSHSNANCSLVGIPSYVVTKFEHVREWGTGVPAWWGQGAGPGSGEGISSDLWSTHGIMLTVTGGNPSLWTVRHNDRQT